jgi:modulator of FtsH protease HflK
VTRERMYLDTMDGVYKNARKVIVDTKGSGNVLYLPIDKLIAPSSQALTGSADGTVPTTRLPEVQVTTPDDSGRARIR